MGAILMVAVGAIVAAAMSLVPSPLHTLAPLAMAARLGVTMPDGMHGEALRAVRQHI